MDRVKTPTNALGWRWLTLATPWRQGSHNEIHAMLDCLGPTPHAPRPAETRARSTSMGPDNPPLEPTEAQGEAQPSSATTAPDGSQTATTATAEPPQPQTLRSSRAATSRSPEQARHAAQGAEVPPTKAGTKKGQLQATVVPPWG